MGFQPMVAVLRNVAGIPTTQQKSPAEHAHPSPTIGSTRPFLRILKDRLPHRYDAGMGSLPERVPLDYSRPTTLQSARWPRWVAVIIAGAVLGGGAGWLIRQYVEQAAARARRQAAAVPAQQRAASAAARYQQWPLEAYAAWQRCSKLAVNPNLIVYENQRGESVPMRGRDEAEDIGFATRSGWGVRLPSDLNALLRRLEIDPASRPGPLLYLGLRKWSAHNSTAGPQELVLVELGAGTDLLPGSGNGTIGFAVTAFAAVGTTGVTARTLNPPTIPVVRPREFLRFYAGESDPSDPTHFTIRYEVSSGSGLLQGWLESDGSLRLEASGPIHPE